MNPLIAVLSIAGAAYSTALEAEIPRVQELMKALQMDESAYALQKKALEAELSSELASAPGCTRNPMVIGSLARLGNLLHPLRWTGVQPLTARGLLGVRYLIASDELVVASQEHKLEKTRLSVKTQFEASLKKPAADHAQAVAESERRVGQALERKSESARKKERLELFVLRYPMADIGPSGHLSLLLDEDVDYKFVDCPPKPSAP